MCDQFDFAVIHTVMAISAPMPKTQMKRPSETGPSEPSENPPGDSFSWRKSSAEMMSRLSSVVRFMSLNTGMFCGPVDHRRVHVERARRVERRGVLALGQRAAGRGDVVAHRAVDAEELGAAGDIALAVEDLLVGEGRAGRLRLHVGGHGVDLVLR